MAAMKDPRGELLISYASERGNKPESVRDAAHEAYHALSVGADTWDREGIHRKLMRKFRGADLWLQELHARAVEQIICETLSVRIEPLKKRINTSVMEAIKYRLPYGDAEQSLFITEMLLNKPNIKQAAENILALVSPPAKKRRSLSHPPRAVRS